MRYVKIPDDWLEHVWIIDESSDDDSGDVTRVEPSFYQHFGNPVDETGQDMVYSHTEIKPFTIDLQVSGGVVHIPNKLPKHIKLNIVHQEV